MSKWENTIVTALILLGPAGILAGMTLELFGRGRLIVPIVMGGVGIGLFWLVSTMP